MVPSHVDWVPPEHFDEYRLVEKLGRGSMGQVWLAHDTVLDRLVAVKFITLPADDAVRQRFLTEARAAARVQHPNIIAIYRVGEIGLRPYLISEYVRGASLDKIARPVPWPRLREIALGLARGLAAAHRGGVLHRDLKPANAILSETGDVKLLDFGLAKLLQKATPSHGDPPPHGGPPPDHIPDHLDAATLPGAPRDPTIVPHVTREPLGPLSIGPRPVGPLSLGSLPSVTTAGAVMGTPAYMSPEAWRGEPATPCSDVYSLGALLYELAAGLPPHRSDSSEAMRGSVLDTDAPPLAVTAPGIDPRFAAVVDRCLRRDPTQRFASGDAMREAIEASASGAADARTSARTLGDHPRPRRVVMVGAVLAVATVLALVAYNLSGGAHSTHPVGSCPDGMIPVPPGSFQMGSPDGEGDTDEHPQHEVTLSAYCIDQTEVTVAAYGECVAAGGCSAAPLTVNWASYSAENVEHYSRWCNRTDRPNHPINCVDWDQAVAYCTWKGRRLPTEAEWEYAARGDDGREYPWGKEPPSAKRLNACGSECLAVGKRELIPWKAMYDGNDGWETTAPVGSYPEGASPFGALDMAGNVWEWTADWYGAYTKVAERNPKGAKTGTSRVSRGGGWGNTAHAADRDWLDPKVREGSLGFRCARGT